MGETEPELGASPALRLRRRYLVSLACVATFVVSGAFAAQMFFGFLKAIPPSINQAGRQRMLSQRLAKDALRLRLARDADSLGAILDSLEQTSSAWVRGHERLRREIESPDALFAGAGARAAMLGVEATYRLMLQACRDLISAYEGSAAGARDPPAAEDAVDRILAHEPLYLSEMDRLVSIYEARASARLGLLRRAALLFILSSILLLVMVGLFVLEPGVRRAHRQFVDTRVVADAARAAERSLEERNRSLEAVFGRYVSNEVVERLLRDPRNLELGGEEREVTLLMADLRGFTALTSSLPPKKTTALLNQYLERMTDVVLDHRGMVGDFIGDCVFAIFGAPSDSAEHPREAAKCALSMQLAIRDVNRVFREEGIPSLQAGVAVHTGTVVAGNIGSLRHAKYGVVGAPVNFTARLESCTPPGRVLVSNATLRRLGPDARVGRDVVIQVKGFELPVQAHELLGIGETLRLVLPKQPQALVKLRKTYPIIYRSVHDDAVSARAFRGEVIRISSDYVEIESTKPCTCPLDERAPPSCPILPVTTGDEVEVSLSPLSERVLPTTAYGRVAEVLEGERPAFRVRFSSTSPAALAILRQLRRANG